VSEKGGTELEGQDQRELPGQKQPELRTIDKLRLENFTAFKDLTMEFSPGINAIIGENATGKTHVLKVLYAVLQADDYDSEIEEDSGDQDIDMDQSFWDRVIAYLQPSAKLLSRLFHKHKLDLTSITAHASTGDHIKHYLGYPVSESESELPAEVYKGRWINNKQSCFIPANEFLSHVKDFIAAYTKKQLTFDETYMEITQKIYERPERTLDNDIVDIIKHIENAIGGRALMEEDDIYLPSHGTKVEISMAPLGHCKLAMLQLLLANGAITPNSILLWDEPEAGLNPKLVGTVVDIMLMLQRMGVQIFFATHDYTLLSWLDLLSTKEHDVKYHALYRDDEGEIRCESSNSLSEIKQNAILDVYQELYNAELNRAKDSLKND